MVVNDETQLKLAIKETVLKPLIKTMALKISGLLKKYIAENWYNTPQSNYYDRTYDFLNSIMESEIVMKGNDFSMEIYLNYDIMQQRAPAAGKFGARTSLNGATEYGGKSISYWLIQWIEEGQNSRVNSYDGINMFQNVSEDLKTQLDNYILESFNKLGIYCTRG